MKIMNQIAFLRPTAALCSALFALTLLFPVGSVVMAEEGVKTEEDDAVQYLKGNDDYLSLEAFDVPEAEPGSFYVEAEKGIISGGIMSVIEDEDASEGKGIAAQPGVTRSNAEEIENVDARYRLTITEAGLYRVYIRIKTPAKSQKSTHFAFDECPYRRVDYSTTIGDYTWFTSTDTHRKIINPTQDR